jgi:Protein of unknown function (DUF3631)
MPEGFLNRLASNWQLMLAIADSLGEEAGARAREAAQQIVGITDLTSAGVALLRDIKTMFDRSTLDYVTSKAVIDNLTSDPEKPWAEWSRGKPITEKGVATLLHEYSIFSRNVGPKEAQAKGYRRADFADVWGRYLCPREEPHSESDILPPTRRNHCDDCTFAEKSAVHRGGGGRKKNRRFSNEFKAVDGWTT